MVCSYLKSAFISLYRVTVNGNIYCEFADSGLLFTNSNFNILIGETFNKWKGIGNGIDIKLQNSNYTLISGVGINSGYYGIVEYTATDYTNIVGCNIFNVVADGAFTVGANTKISSTYNKGVWVP